MKTKKIFFSLILTSSILLSNQVQSIDDRLFPPDEPIVNDVVEEIVNVNVDIPQQKTQTIVSNEGIIPIINTQQKEIKSIKENQNFGVLKQNKTIKPIKKEKIKNIVITKQIKKPIITTSIKQLETDLKQVVQIINEYKTSFNTYPLPTNYNTKLLNQKWSDKLSTLNEKTKNYIYDSSQTQKNKRNIYIKIPNEIYPNLQYTPSSVLNDICKNYTNNIVKEDFFAAKMSEKNLICILNLSVIASN